MIATWMLYHIAIVALPGVAAAVLDEVAQPFRLGTGAQRFADATLSFYGEKRPPAGRIFIRRDPRICLLQVTPRRSCDMSVERTDHPAGGPRRRSGGDQPGV
jgi:hypothetical protein